MQHAVFNGKNNSLDGCFPLGQLFKDLITIPRLFGERLFGERDTTKHPYHSTPDAFETEELYYGSEGGHTHG